MYEDTQEAIKAIYNALNTVYQLCKTEPILKYPLIFIITGQIICLPIRVFKKIAYIDNCRMHKEPEKKTKKTWKYEENVEIRRKRGNTKKTWKYE